MAGNGDESTWRSTEARGERAWKEATEGVASRNVAAQKAGKQEREAYERRRDGARRKADATRQARLMKRKDP
jgi:hypothetical protein